MENEKYREEIFTYLNNNKNKCIVQVRLSPSVFTKVVEHKKGGLPTFINDNVRLIKDIWIKDDKVTFHDRILDEVGELYLKGTEDED